METQPIPVCIGGDSSPASVHGSPLKWTHNESVSTDLHDLSRGFIPGGIVVPRVWNPALRIIGYGNPPYGWKLWQKGVMELCLFGTAGTQVPPQFMEVHSSDS